MKGLIKNHAAGRIRAICQDGIPSGKKIPGGMQTDPCRHRPEDDERYQRLEAVVKKSGIGSKFAGGTTEQKQCVVDSPELCYNSKLLVKNCKENTMVKH